jgi:hypothetical protein
MLVPRTEHDADRPSWDCRVCDQPWPCANAKIDLIDQYQRSRTMLILFMSSCMIEAINDLFHSQRIPGDLHARFLDWVHTAMPQPSPDLQRGKPDLQAN